MQEEMTLEFEFQTRSAWVRHVEELNQEWTEEDEMGEPAWVCNGPQYSGDDRSSEVWIERPIPIVGELIHRLDGVVVLHVEVFFSCEGDVQSVKIREVCDDEVWPDDDAVGVDSLTPVETALAWDRAEAAC